MPDSAEVPLRNLGTAFVPFVETIELHPQHRRLQFVEPAVVALDCVLVLFRRPVVREKPYPFDQVTVVSRDRTPVAVRSEILGRVEAPRGEIPEGSDTLPRERAPCA